MLLYLGGKYFVRSKNIIGIFDLDSATVSNKTREFLEFHEKQKNIVYSNIYEFPRSFVVTDDVIYISPIVASTLNRRLTKGLI